jgi:hypothetical protein
MTAQIHAVVQRGPYIGRTKAQMDAELERYHAQLGRSGTTLRGASMSGKSYQVGPRLDWSLGEWSRQIAFAMSQVSPDFIAPSHSHLVRFGGD